MKCVLIDENEKLLFSKYIKHQAKIAQTAVEILGEAEKYCRGEKVGVPIPAEPDMETPTFSPRQYFSASPRISTAV